MCEALESVQLTRRWALNICSSCRAWWGLRPQRPQRRALARVFQKLLVIIAAQANQQPSNWSCKAVRDVIPYQSYRHVTGPASQLPRGFTRAIDLVLKLDNELRVHRKTISHSIYILHSQYPGCSNVAMQPTTSSFITAVAISTSNSLTSFLGSPPS